MRMFHLLLLAVVILVAIPGLVSAQQTVCENGQCVRAGPSWLASMGNVAMPDTKVLAKRMPIVEPASVAFPPPTFVQTAEPMQWRGEPNQRFPRMRRAVRAIVSLPRRLIGR